MKRFLSVIIAVVIYNIATAQSYNTEYNYLGNFIQRMYQSEPFQGAKIISDIDKCYLICVSSENITSNELNIQRKAEIKAMSYANDFLNGRRISSNTILYTKEDSKGNTYEEIEEFIDSHSMGYVQQMQLLSTFIDDKGKKVFIYCKELAIPDKKQTRKNKRK